MGEVRRMLRRLRLWLGCTAAFLLLTSTGLRATHIIGGDISMQAVGTTPGLFRIQLNQYWDETKTGTGNRDPYVILLLYRKQNPKLIDTLRLPLQEAVPLTFNNTACAKSFKLNFTEARYYVTHQFDPSLYTDPGGYYMVWERCCRNDALSNAISVGGAGVAMVFYLEFPAMQANNRPFINSSPDFGIPNGDYICINKPFTFSVGATDADGDQLRYSLVTPLNGYTNRTAPLGNSSVKASYPIITWAPGISLTNIIPGNPPLSINPSTGQLSVRATTQGLYLFTVQCEEFRNGQRIGLVRRDFQLPVTDCSRTTPPPAVVTVDSIARSSVVWCPTQPLTLAIAANPLYAYQWQKDGTNLRGDTLSSLTVKEAGRYTVVTSQATTCSNDTTSQAVQVTIATPSAVSLSLVSPQPYCTGDTILLRAVGQPDYLYRWQYNGKAMAGQQQATLRVSGSGQYTVLARSSANACEGKDSLRVTINVRPAAQLTASTTAFCPDASAQLTVPDDGSGNKYAWKRDGNLISETTSTLTVRQAGTYQVTVTNPAGCTATSQKQPLTRYDPVTVQLDSIAPLCSTNNTTATLHGQPGGGVYAGPGVTGSQFNPAVAGAGRHQLTYTVTSANGCRTVQSRYVTVTAGPILSGPTEYQIVKGDSVRLNTTINEPVASYRWEPPIDLDRTNVASPIANPPKTMAYQLTAVDAGGCTATFAVQVEVVEPLYIPSAFSPNADGRNDAWLIPNITSFPLCEVAVYDRWGELIFFSKGYTRPWDGMYRQKPVSEGVYTYRISTGPGALNATYRGKVVVIH